MRPPLEHTALHSAILAAIARKSHGTHRVLLGESPARAAAIACAVATAARASLYAVQLTPWLSAGSLPLEPLAPYAHVARFAGRPTLVLVCDGASLAEPAHAAWRSDPLGARLVRRTMLSTPAPTLWWAPARDALPPEVSAHCPEVQLAPGPLCACAPACAPGELCAVALANRCTARMA